VTRVRWLALILGAVGVGGAGLWLFWPHHENVILITIDTMRPDRISAYGYDKHRTPNLDRLATEGTLFENAFCDVTWTTPSMASVMTGTYATRHGLRSSFQTLKPEAITLAEILRNHEMHTAAIIASYPLASIFGLNQGFDLYDETFTAPLALDDEVEFGPQPAVPQPDRPPSDDTVAMRLFLVTQARSNAYRSDDQVSDRAIAWLRKERRDPFFLWIHYFGPHEKPTGYVGLEKLAKERGVQLAAYDPDVVTVDQAIGRVLATLDELGLAADTAVIVHADHGQSLMEHDYFGHGRNVYDPTAHIPLIIRAPEHVPAGRRDALIARNVDILPTVLALLKIPNPVQSDGVDLFARPPGADPSAYVETYLSGTWLFADRLGDENDTRIGYRRLGIRTAHWKYVMNDPIPMLDSPDAPFDDAFHRRYYTEELYDLTADPGETRSVTLQRRDVAEHLRQAILTLHSVAPTKSEAMPLDYATRDKLKALGYLAE
jgi:arylsulfatase A-like enzyme